MHRFLLRSGAGVLFAASLLWACDGGGGGFIQRPGGYSEHREGEVLRRYRGQWALPAGSSLTARATSFLAAPPVRVELPPGVSYGAGRVVGRHGATVVFPLESAGIPIEGAEVRVHAVREWVLAITVRVPSMVMGSNVPLVRREDAVAQVMGRESGLEVRGTPELRFVMPRMLVGEPAPAILHFRVVLDDHVAHRPRVYYVDANDGMIRMIEPLARRAIGREVWDCHGAASERRCREERTNRVYDARDAAPLVPDPSAAARRAHALALESCERLEALHRDDAACNPLVSFTGFGAASGYAAAQEGRLFFGPGALDHADDRAVFEHEVAHALLHRHTDLAGTLEPGAIGEALADVFAMLATRADEWRVRGPGGLVVRDLESPRRTMHPVRFDERRLLAETWTADDSNDWGEVHSNSTILSHALWIATIDGVEVGGVRHAGIGYEKVEQILHIALTEYSGRMTTLRQAADDLAAACNREAAATLIYETASPADHHYITPHDCAVLRNALAEVDLLEPDRDMDSWEDANDVCPDHYNPLQLRSETGACVEETRIEPPDGGVGDAGPVLADFPAAPLETPTCPAMMAFSARAFPAVTIRLDSQSAPSCVGCTGRRGAGYAVSCRYRNAVDDRTYDVQLLWQPHDRALVRVDDTMGPSRHEHCGAAARVWTRGATGGGTAYSHDRSAVVSSAELPSDGAADEERDRLYFILDQLEMLAAPCP